MSDNVYISGQNAENATLLLAAAEELGQEPFVVATVDGGFNVPQEVAEKAGFDNYGRPKSRAAKQAEKAAEEDDGSGAPTPENDAAKEQAERQAEAAEKAEAEQKAAAKKAAPRSTAKKAAPSTSKE